jgi:hypothetical protein
MRKKKEKALFSDLSDYARCLLPSPPNVHNPSISFLITNFFITYQLYRMLDGVESLSHTGPQVRQALASRDYARCLALFTDAGGRLAAEELLTLRALRDIRNDLFGLRQVTTENNRGEEACTDLFAYTSEIWTKVKRERKRERFALEGSEGHPQ